MAKRRAIHRLLGDARKAGFGEASCQRIHMTVDELLINALYHAPSDAHGQKRYRKESARELAAMPHLDPVELQYCASSSCFALAVRDHFGSLSKARLTSCLQQALSNTERSGGSDAEQGQGLGLVTAARSASRLIFKLDPGNATQAIAIFEGNINQNHHARADTEIIIAPEHWALTKAVHINAPQR